MRKFIIKCDEGDKLQYYCMRYDGSLPTFFELHVVSWKLDPKLGMLLRVVDFFDEQHMPRLPQALLEADEFAFKMVEIGPPVARYLGRSAIGKGSLIKRQSPWYIPGGLECRGAGGRTILRIPNVGDCAVPNNVECLPLDWQPGHLVEYSKYDRRW